MSTPEGLLYYPNIIPIKEQDILTKILTNGSEIDPEWKKAGHMANRLVRHYGYNYPYTRKLELTKADPIPDYIVDIVNRLITLPGLENFRPDQAIINRYLTGEGIGKHIDHTELFTDIVVSVSFGCKATMRFKKDSQTMDQVVTPGSAYAMTGSSRYEWTHEMVKSRTQCDTRFSITFREINQTYLKKGQSPHPPIAYVPTITPVSVPAPAHITQPKLKLKLAKLSARPKAKLKTKPTSCTCCSDAESK